MHDKKKLLEEQAQKIAEVMQTLSENFDQEEIADELSFLNIAHMSLLEMTEEEME